MNRRLTNALYRHHYPIKFPYFSDDADGFCVQTKHLLLLEQIRMTLDIIHNTNNNMTKSSYFCLLETKNLWRGRFTLQERNLYKVTIFKIKSRRKPFFAESSKCSLLLILIDSSPTPALLHHWFIQSSTMCLSIYVSIFCSFLGYLSLLLHILISWYPGYFARVVCTQDLPSTLFWRKNSSPPIRWMIDEVLAWSFSWKQFSKI